jgi:methyl-accepting chemotaxis protein
MSDDASGVAKKVSGSEMDDIRRGFADMLSWVENLTGGMQSEKETIHLILSHFDGLAQPLEEFEKVVRILNVLCNFIKIEIARLGLRDTSFQKLSEDVQQMAGVINRKIAALTHQSQSAIPSLLSNVSLIESSNLRQEVQGRQIMESVGSNLGAISAKHEESSKTIQDISETWKRISEHVGEVVQSLQLHDITRQRVEHVLEALDELPRKLNDMDKTPADLPESGVARLALKVSRAGRSRRRELIADTFELQAAQLQGAVHDLNEAVEHILASLRLVAKDATAMSERICSTPGKSGDRQAESFMLQLERGIDCLTESADEILGIKKELAQAMSLMSQTAAGMSVFAKEMEIIGIEMQRLALNARVHAAHLGDQGATLGVLADAIHQMSLDTSSRVSAITGHLQAVSDSAARLADMAGAEGSDSRSGRENMRDHFSGMSTPLKKMESEVGELLPRIEKSGMDLSADIDHLLTGVRIHKTVSADVAKVVAYLKASAAAMMANRAPGRPEKKTRLLADLSERYTMHRERTTHNVSVGERAVKPKPAVSYAAEKQRKEPDPPIAKANEGDDLGDNVELF